VASGYTVPVKAGRLGLWRFVVTTEGDLISEIPAGATDRQRRRSMNKLTLAVPFVMNKRLKRPEFWWAYALLLPSVVPRLIRSRNRLVRRSCAQFRDPRDG
jgi:hypothetical protein